MLKLLGSTQTLITSVILAIIGLIIVSRHINGPSPEKIKQYQSMIDKDSKIAAIIERRSEFEMSGTIYSHSYTHRYRFDIDSVRYEGMFTSKNSFTGRDSVWVYYNTDNPAINTRDPWSAIADENGKKASPKSLTYAIGFLITGCLGIIISLVGIFRRNK